MKRAIIVHGWEGGTHEPQLQWLAEELRSKGYEVLFEDMPNTDEPKIEEWLPKLQEIITSPNEETLLIGHSIGCRAILFYLESLSEGQKVGQVILLAAWIVRSEDQIQRLKQEGDDVWEIAKPWAETPIDYDKVKKHFNSMTAIFSDNDAYVSLDNVGLFEEKLGAKTKLVPNRHHFDPGAGVTDLPEVLEEVE